MDNFLKIFLNWLLNLEDKRWKKPQKKDQKNL